MKKTIALITRTTIVALAISACEPFEHHPDIIAIYGTKPVGQMVGHVNTSDAFRFKELTKVDGAGGYFIRLQDRVVVRATAGGLPPNAAFTCWFAIFNDPENCMHPRMGGNRCTPPDFDNPATNSSSNYGDDGITDPNGNFTCASTIKVGDTRNAQSGSGLLDAMKADIHILFRNHGPLGSSTATISKQLTVFNGACKGSCPNMEFVYSELPSTSNYIAYQQDGTVVGADDKPIANASSSLFRADSSIDGFVAMENIDDSHVYSLTAWVFNNPDRCTHGSTDGSTRCGEADLDDPNVHGARIWQAAGLGRMSPTAMMTTLNLAVHIERSDTGPLTSLKADVILVLHDHGMPDPSNAFTQMTTMADGCSGACPKFAQIVYQKVP